MEFIDANRDEVVEGERLGVEPIVTVLREVGGPSSYYAHKTRPLSKRARRDAELTQIWVDNYSVYGVRKLAWWIPPQRMRIEFLNPERNPECYGDDPLAPARYGADWPFATTLVANPLGWFEASGLSPAFADAVASLARIWKGQRDELHAGVILPVGTRPSGPLPVASYRWG